MKYIRRDIERGIVDLSGEYSCIFLTGPRQVGKTTVFKELMDAGREYVSLDDAGERMAARNDPALFVQTHPCPMLLDKVQYASELFSYIKTAIDSGAARGYERIWRGSVTIIIMVVLSLAGYTTATAYEADVLDGIYNISVTFHGVASPVITFY